MQEVRTPAVVAVMRTRQTRYRAAIESNHARGFGGRSNSACGGDAAVVADAGDEREADLHRRSVDEAQRRRRDAAAFRGAYAREKRVRAHERLAARERRFHDRQLKEIRHGTNARRVLFDEFEREALADDGCGEIFQILHDDDFLRRRGGELRELIVELTEAVVGFPVNAIFSRVRVRG